MDVDEVSVYSLDTWSFIWDMVVVEAVILFIFCFFMT